jgi:translation elongation factor EF-Ts
MSQLEATAAAAAAAAAPEQGKGKSRAQTPEQQERVVQGRLDKRLAEMCLLSQAHAAEEGLPPVSRHLAAQSQVLALSTPLTVGRMLRWSVGEATGGQL